MPQSFNERHILAIGQAICLLGDPIFRKKVDGLIEASRQAVAVSLWFQKTHLQPSLTYCAYFSMTRLADCSGSARTAGMDTQAGGSAAAPCRTSPARALANFVACRMAGDEPDLSWLACARGVRFCAHTQTLARFRTPSGPVF